MAKSKDMAKENLTPGVCLIGGSAGSLEVLLEILPEIGATDYALVLVLHRRGTEDMKLEELFAAKLQIPVCEINDKTKLKAGRIYIAPADYHLLFEKDYTLSLDVSEKVNYSRPSLDVSFSSAADAFGPNLTTILLSGANADGTQGLAAVRDRGGTIVVQSPETAIMPVMPRNALTTLKPDYVLAPSQMTAYLRNIPKKSD